MTNVANSKQELRLVVPKLTIGLDVGDKSSYVYVVDGGGQVVCERTVPTKGPVMALFFSKYRGARVALEVGTHSPWLSRLLAGLGLEVIVANARKVRLIGENERKNDRMDAKLLARNYSVRHRGALNNTG